MDRSTLFRVLLLLITSIYTLETHAEGAIEPLKARYQKLGAGQFSAESGRLIWNRKVRHKRSGKQRSCVDCHGTQLSKKGRHIRTGKVIKPLSPAIEAKRFSSIKSVEKWFKRNCKWTFGRPCSPQEKGDILTFIQQQSWRRP